MNRLIFAVLSTVLVFAAGCVEKAPGKAIIVAIPTSPTTLDPRLATDAEGDKISHIICDGLFYRNKELEPEPAIAESYEKLSDTSFRFKLRGGVVFHDGTLLTSEDVVYTLKSMIDGSVRSPYAATFERISDVVAEDPLTVRIDLKEPYAPFINMLTRGIVSKKAAMAKGEKFGREPVCAGPYRIVKFTPETRIELEANEAYYGEKPKNTGITFEVIKDDNIRVMKLMKGDVDLIQNAITPAVFKVMNEGGKFDVRMGEGIVMSYMGFNLTHPLLSKKAVRKAIAYAIDRDAIIAHKWQGLASRANSIMSPDNWAYDENLADYSYDPEKAAKLLDEAGFKDPDGAGPATRFNLIYKTSTNKDRVDIARMVANQLAKVGIGVRVEPGEWGKFYSDVKKGNFQIYSLSWVGITDPDVFYEVCHSSQFPPEGLNRDRYKNPEIDSLVEAGRKLMDRDKRRAVYSKVQEILIDDLPYLPLWYEKNVVVFRKGVTGAEPWPDASYRAFTNVTKE